MAPRLDSIDKDTRPNDCFLDAMSARVADPLTSVLSAGEQLRPFSQDSCTASIILSQSRGRGGSVNGLTWIFVGGRVSAKGAVDGLRQWKQSVPRSSSSGKRFLSEEAGDSSGVPILFAAAGVPNRAPCVTPATTFADIVSWAGRPRRAAPRLWLTSNCSTFCISAAQSALATPVHGNRTMLETRALGKRR